MKRRKVKRYGRDPAYLTRYSYFVFVPQKKKKKRKSSG